MSHSSLSQFSAAIRRAAAEHFPHANRCWLRVKKVVLDPDTESQLGANPNSPSPRCSLRRFRRLFGAAQSTVSSKLSNPLKKFGFLVSHKPLAETPGRIRLCPEGPPKL